MKTTLSFPVQAPEAKRPKCGQAHAAHSVRKYAFRGNCELLYSAFISNNKDDLFFLAGIILSHDGENSNNHIQPLDSIRLSKLIDFSEKQFIHLH